MTGLRFEVFDICNWDRPDPNIEWTQLSRCRTRQSYCRGRASHSLPPLEPAPNAVSSFQTGPDATVRGLADSGRIAGAAREACRGHARGAPPSVATGWL